jgi:hypothetical protein
MAFFATTSRELNKVGDYLTQYQKDNPEAKLPFAVVIKQSQPYGLKSFDEMPVEIEVTGDLKLFTSVFSFSELVEIEPKEGCVNVMGEFTGDMDKYLQTVTSTAQKDAEKSRAKNEKKAGKK